MPETRPVSNLTARCVKGVVVGCVAAVAVAIAATVSIAVVSFAATFGVSHDAGGGIGGFSVMMPDPMVASMAAAIGFVIGFFWTILRSPR